MPQEDERQRWAVSAEVQCQSLSLHTGTGSCPHVHLGRSAWLSWKLPPLEAAAEVQHDAGAFGQ